MTEFWTHEELVELEVSVQPFLPAIADAMDNVLSGAATHLLPDDDGNDQANELGAESETESEGDREFAVFVHFMLLALANPDFIDDYGEFSEAEQALISVIFYRGLAFSQHEQGDFAKISQEEGYDYDSFATHFFLGYQAFFKLFPFSVFELMSSSGFDRNKVVIDDNLSVAEAAAQVEDLLGTVVNVAKASGDLESIEVVLHFLENLMAINPESGDNLESGQA